MEQVRQLTVLVHKMHGNHSEHEMKLFLSTEASIFMATFTSLQIFIGSIANCIVIITILVARELRKRSEDRLILNLAVADFLALTTFLPWHTHVLSQRNMSESHYKIYESLNTLAGFYGGNAIVAIAIDRFIAVVLPLRHRNIMTRTTAFVMAMGTLAVAACLGIIDFLSSWFKQLENIKVLLLPYNLILPLAMAVLYFIIFSRTLKQSRTILKQRRSVGADCENYSSRLLIKITLKTFLLVLLYYVTYLPVMIYGVYSSVVTAQPRITQLTARSWIYSFMYLNSCVNPFVYALRTKRFKAAFYRKIWSKIFHHSGSPESHRQFSVPIA